MIRRPGRLPLIDSVIHAFMVFFTLTGAVVFLFVAVADHEAGATLTTFYLVSFFVWFLLAAFFADVWERARRQAMRELVTAVRSREATDRLLTVVGAAPRPAYLELDHTCTNGTPARECPRCVAIWAEMDKIKAEGSAS